jgi:hypothetical protein
MIYQITTRIESENNKKFSLLTIVQKKRLNMNMYEWMYLHENVSYRSCTKEKRNVINTHYIYIINSHFLYKKYKVEILILIQWSFFLIN